MRVALNTSTNTGLHITVRQQLMHMATVITVTYLVQAPDFRYLWFQFNKRFPDFELAVPRSISQVCTIMTESCYTKMHSTLKNCQMKY